jgi:hypothetical protein
MSEWFCASCIAALYSTSTSVILDSSDRSETFVPRGFDAVVQLDERLRLLQADGAHVRLVINGAVIHGPRAATMIGGTATCVSHAWDTSQFPVQTQRYGQGRIW